jgi:hypothetical protein
MSNYRRPTTTAAFHTSMPDADFAQRPGQHARRARRDNANQYHRPLHLRQLNIALRSEYREGATQFSTKENINGHQAQRLTID